MKLTTAREGTLETAKETFNEETKSKAVVLACEHSRLDAVADLSTETMPISVDVTVERRRRSQNPDRPLQRRPLTIGIHQ